jgi:hypothetical protein
MSPIVCPYRTAENAVPQLAWRSGDDALINGDHPCVEARFESGFGRRIYVRVGPVPWEFIRLMRQHATGDVSQVLYEGPIEENAKRKRPLRVEVQHANSIVTESGVIMIFWSTGVPEQAD